MATTPHVTDPGGPVTFAPREGEFPRGVWLSVSAGRRGSGTGWLESRNRKSRRSPGRNMTKSRSFQHFTVEVFATQLYKDTARSARFGSLSNLGSHLRRSSAEDSLRPIVISLLLLVVAIFGTRALAQSSSASAPAGPTPVVFVCEHGSFKSLVATVYFNRRAEERGLPYRAIARGTAPQPGVPRSVREGLRADGFDVSTFEPRLLKSSDLDAAALVVSFDQDITKTVHGGVRHLQWDGLPDEYSRGRDAIVKHVDALIDELAQSVSP